MKLNYKNYVHEYTDDDGKTWYAVCEWDEEHSQYVQPMNTEEARLTGCYAYFARKLSGITAWPTRAQARYQARVRFGLGLTEDDDYRRSGFGAR